MGSKSFTWALQRWINKVFAFFHELLGPIFDEQAFHDAFPTVILEYSKKYGLNLQFHDYTGVNERYNPGCFPSFNLPLGAVELLECESISKQTVPGKCVAIPQPGYTTTITIIIIITSSTIHIITPTLHISCICLTPSSNRHHHIMNMHFQTPCTKKKDRFLGRRGWIRVPVTIISGGTGGEGKPRKNKWYKYKCLCLCQ